MSQFDKLIERILKLDKKLRFDELDRVMKKIGYTQHQAGTGSSHYTYRKPGLSPVTIPKGNPINKVYVEKVRDALIIHFSEVDTNE